MTQRLFSALATFLLIFLASAEISSARGFGGGGFGGGGFRGGGGFGGGGIGGGFGGGGFGGGGIGGGGFGGGGFGSGGIGGGGFAGGIGGGGGFHGGENFGGGFAGSAPGGLGGVGGFGGGGFAGAGMGGDRLGGAGGFGGGAAVGESRFAGFGPNGLGAGGLPSDEGLHDLAAGPSGVNPRGGDIATSSARGPIADGAAGRAAFGPFGAAAARGVAVGAGGYAAGFGRISPSARYTTAAAVRGGFRNFDMYRRPWYAARAAAWYPAAWADGTAWYTTTWDSLAVLMDFYGTAPIYFDYGNTITYQDGSVYSNGQNEGTAEAYSAQASRLADDETAAQASKDDNWLPLGVFALCKPGESQSDITVQLAVNRAGVIRGNYTVASKNETLPVHGSVDKKTQRLAFTVGDDKTTVLETGLYNLTKPDAPALIHYGKDRTEQWLLVGVQKPIDPDSY